MIARRMEKGFSHLQTSVDRHREQLPQQAIYATEDEDGHRGAGALYEILRTSAGRASEPVGRASEPAGRPGESKENREKREKKMDRFPHKHVKTRIYFYMMMPLP